VTVKLWGGNYSGDPDREFWEFNRSFPFDRRLLREEIAASRAYVAALGRCGALPAADASALDRGLERVLAEAGDVASSPDDPEDVHSYVEEKLGAIVGDLAGQAHIARSRNEQAVTALRLWIRSAIDALRERTASLVAAIVAQGQAGLDAPMPGYTHTRAAEPITLGHFAAAHAAGLARDFWRLGDVRKRVNILPLGSGALAGTALALDRDALARDLGFDAVSWNALDAVTDRDFAAEFVSACALLQTHMARLAEDLIWMSGPEYGFFSLPDTYTTGSSLMPQKKNPDALELIRGKAARVDGAVVRMLALMKGVPTGYQKDLQEDKEAVFDAADTVLASLGVMAGVIGGLVVHRDAMRRAASQPEMLAASLAVALAREGLPFRRAHSLVGAMVAESQKSKKPLRAVAEVMVAKDHPALLARLDELFDLDRAIAAKAAPGGTAPASVKAALDAALRATRPAP
jgi:argininosuccinate lyase